MKDEFVRREEQIAEVTLDAFSTRAIVAGRMETALAAPATFMVHAKGEILGQLRRGVLLKK